MCLSSSETGVAGCCGDLDPRLVHTSPTLSYCFCTSGLWTVHTLPTAHRRMAGWLVTTG